MPKTPRFVVYQDNKDETFIIHMYHPRFVARFNALNNYEIWEQWDEDVYNVSVDEAFDKLQKWHYFKYKKGEQ